MHVCLSVLCVCLSARVGLSQKCMSNLAKFSVHMLSVAVAGSSSDDSAIGLLFVLPFL